MPPRSSIMARKSSQKKGVASLEARRRPRTTSGPQLGRYGRKSPKLKLTPGHKAILRRRVLPSSRPPQPRELLKFSRAGREFLNYCIKHILTSSNLVLKEGSNWKVNQSVAGVNPGEFFTSLDACAESMISYLEAQYKEQVPSAA